MSNGTASGIHTLPPELVTAILTTLIPSNPSFYTALTRYRALNTFSQVCSIWRSISQPLLFAHLVLPSPERANLLLEQIETNTDLASCVRSADFGSEWNSSLNCLSNWLSKKKKLETFRFWDTSEEGERLIGRTLELCPNLSRLRISAMIRLDMHAILSYGCNLTSLEIANTTVSWGPRYGTSSPQNSPQAVTLAVLDSISFRSVHFHSDLSTQLLLPQFVPALTTLQIINVTPRYSPAPALSCNVAGQLRSLTRRGDLTADQHSWSDLKDYQNLVRFDTSLRSVEAVSQLPKSVESLRLSTRPGMVNSGDEIPDYQGLTSGFKLFCRAISELDRGVKNQDSNLVELVVAKEVFEGFSEAEKGYWRELEKGLMLEVEVEP